MTVGKRIKQRRIELNLTQTELAKRMGYKSKAAISNVENDKEDLTTDRVRKYAAALECSPGYLMGWGAELETYVNENAPERLSAYAEKMYELYLKASPKIQKAVDDLLKPEQ